MANAATISIASATTSGLNFSVLSPTTKITKNSLVTLDINAVSTTPPVDGYVKLYVAPVSWYGRT